MRLHMHDTINEPGRTTNFELEPGPLKPSIMKSELVL
jgi:hypothetical protein